MSLINRMLADLDERRSSPAGGARVFSDLTPELRPGVTTRSGPWVAGLVVLGAVAGGLSGHWVRGVADARDVPAASRVVESNPAVSPAVPAEAALTLGLGTDPAVLAALATLPAAVTAPGMPPAADTPQPPAESAAAAVPAPADPGRVAITPAAPPEPAIALVMEAEAVPLKPSNSGPETRAGTPAAAPSPPPRISRIPAATPPPESRRADRYQLALRAVEQGKTRRAINELHGLLKDDPEATEARLLLSRVYLKQGRRGEARRLLEAGLAGRTAQPALADMLARLLLDAGEPAAAAATLRRAPPAVAEAPEYHAFLAALEQRLGRHGAAIATYRNILEVAPDSGVWRMGLAISLVAVGERTAAIDAFLHALTDPGLSPDLREYVNSEMRRLDAVSG